MFLRSKKVPFLAQVLSFKLYESLITFSFSTGFLFGKKKKCCVICDCNRSWQIAEVELYIHTKK